MYGLPVVLGLMGGGGGGCGTKMCAKQAEKFGCPTHLGCFFAVTTLLHVCLLRDRGSYVLTHNTCVEAGIYDHDI